MFESVCLVIAGLSLLVWTGSLASIMPSIGVGRGTKMLFMRLVGAVFLVMGIVAARVLSIQ